MLVSGEAVLVVVDIQGKLAHLMFEKEILFDNVRKMIRGAQVLGIPILWAEQNPDGLGPTIRQISELIPDGKPISKLSFSCCGEDRFMQELEALRRKQVLLAGIESHVCIYQTARDLLGLDYEVHVIADAVSSRRRENREIALMRMRDMGAIITSTETVLFELLKVAEGPAFKEILDIVR